MRKVYFDHAATTPTRSEVVDAMIPYFTEQFGNPSSLHQYGQWTRAAIEEARDRIANLLGVKSSEIIFTSGGTESDNMAIKGVCLANLDKPGHIITSSIEHHAVLYAVQYAKKLGFETTFLDVDQEGFVNPDDLRKAIKKDTMLVSIMTGNNETGTIEPIKELAEVAHEFDVPFHTDAVQAVGKIPLNINELGVDFLASSAHKLYGPKGMGICYIKEDARDKIESISHGGSHEFNMRPGTENIAGIIGYARALELAVREMKTETMVLNELTEMLFEGMNNHLDGVHLNGPKDNRLPGFLNLSFDDVSGESMLMSLDMQGIAVSSGSACASGENEPSHVLLSMGLDPIRAHSSLRFSLGRSNSEDDIDYILRVFPPMVEKLRMVSKL